MDKPVWRIPSMRAGVLFGDLRGMALVRWNDDGSTSAIPWDALTDRAPGACDPRDEVDSLRYALDGLKEGS